ncbi:GfdT [Labilithrix luteola]|uniref:GfdT n=1 Tax=Labilithrix luteola TaxID=1391654 RepID=A0A0K1QBP8_9BACT|nr:FIST N-terminal domain-containing protein [Labilithrix luteola]AKV02835.1 GfdT [Labilithrix luteola]
MASMALASARTSEMDEERAAEAICSQFGATPPKLVTFFASRDRDHRALNRALRRRLPRARLVGASTSGEIDRDGIHSGSIVASALSGDFDVGVGVGRDLSRDAVAAGATALYQACAQLGVPPANLGTRHVGMVVDDGSRDKKEEFLMGMLEPNPALVLVGGGAGRLDEEPASSVLHVDDEVLDDAVFLLLFQTDVRWAALRSHAYVPTGKKLLVTKVDSSFARALEIDGRPAAARYAELLGVDVTDLGIDKPAGFATWPTARRIGREYFIHGPSRPLDDGSILFSNLLSEGTELELMQLDDLAGSTARFLREEVPARVGPPAAAFVFHCQRCMSVAETRGTTQDVSRAFHAAPVVGMNAYLEVYCGFQMTSTLTALAFGSS